MLYARYWRILKVNLCSGVIVVLSACSSSSSRPIALNQAPNDSKCRTEALEKQIAEIGNSINGTLGASAELLENGERVAINPKRRFPMQSVYKLPIAMAVLRQIENGSLKFDQNIEVKPRDFVSAGQHSPLRDANPNGVAMPINALLSLMVSESDGTACDVLLDLLGGPVKVTAYLRELGINEVIVATSEKAMAQDQQVQYQNWATPDALIQLLRLLYEGRGISKTNREILLSWMTISPTGPNRIKGKLPPGTDVAHKTGSSGTINGLTRATNDVGIVKLSEQRHLAIAVLISDTTADESSRDAVIAKISRAAYDCWSAPTR